MKKYEKYKDSEIKWLGKIPEHWEVRRIKDIFAQVSLNSNHIERGSYIPLENIESGTGKLLKRCSNENNENTNLFKSGDILLNKLRPYLNKVLFSQFDGGVSGEAIVIRPYRPLLKNICTKYYFYYLLSEKFNLKLDSLSDGVKMPRTNPHKVFSLSLFLPLLKEQVTIANYLDSKTQIIDKKIELLNKKIQKYRELRKTIINQVVCRGLNGKVKLRESGIEWIGKIPEHWNVCRLKDSFEAYSGNSISDKADFENILNGLPYIATKDIGIECCDINYNNGIFIPRSKLKKFKISPENSIFLCIEGANAGKKIGFNTQKVCFVNKLCSIKSKRRYYLDKYYYYQFQSNMLENQFFKVLNGMIGGVSINSLKTFYIIIPPFNEQNEIVHCIDDQVMKINKIITIIQHQIAKLQELRKTLINDVVTGKIKVTE